MTGGVVLLGTEHRSRLEYPVIDTHHGLLVKLRALSQLCLLVKVIQPEHIGAAFCAAGHDLRRADFRKMLGMKEIPEASDDTFLNAEFRPFHGVSQRDGAKGKLRLQGSVQLPLADGDGKNLGRC